MAWGKWLPVPIFPYLENLDESGSWPEEGDDFCPSLEPMELSPLRLPHFR